MKQKTKTYRIVQLVLGLVISAVVSFVLLRIGMGIAEARTGFAAQNISPYPITAFMVYVASFVVLVNPIYYYFKPNDVLYRLVLYSGIGAIPVLVVIFM